MPTELGLGSDHADENRIIAQSLAGDRKAYTLLVERYKDLVHDLVYRMIGDAARAEDIAQDAFVKGYLSLRDFRGESRNHCDPWTTVIPFKSDRWLSPPRGRR